MPPEKTPEHFIRYVIHYLRNREEKERPDEFYDHAREVRKSTENI